MNQKKSLIVLIFVILISLGSILVYAHGGHGDEEAAKLWTTTTNVSVGFVSPIKTISSDIPAASYHGLITSDAYGSVFSSREGIITQLSTNLGDKVSKGQVIGTISIVSNTPEIIALIAGKKSEIAIAEGKKEAAVRVKAYMENQMKAPDSTFQNAYDQKRNATELWYKIRAERLLAQIESTKAQIEAKRKIIAANTKSSIAVTQSSDQKVLVAQKTLQGAIDRSYSTISKIFYSSNETQMKRWLGFWEAFLSTTSQKDIFPLQQKIAALVILYNTKDMSSEGLSRTASAAEEALRQALTVVSATDITLSYPSTQLESDKKDLIALLGDDNGISVALNRIHQIQKEGVSLNASSEAQLAQSDADIISFEQEIILLQKELAQLDSEKKKDLAGIAGDQSVQSLSLYTISLDSKKIINESNRDLIVADAEVKAAQKALWAVTGISSQSFIYAPFAGTISRKNVSIGQSVQTSTPIYDIVGNTKSNMVFIRWDIPVADLTKLSLGKSVTVALPGGKERYTAIVKRIAGSVNKEDQTVSFETVFAGDTPYPLGTQVRILPDLAPESVYKIPVSALFEEWTDAYVWKVMPNQTLKKWKVGIIRISGEDYVFVSDGLTEASVIIQDTKSQAWAEWQTVNLPTV